MAAYMQDNYYSRYEPGMSHYAANNSTAMAAPFELHPDDIAQLDEDMTTHAFKQDYLQPPTPFPAYRRAGRDSQERPQYATEKPATERHAAGKHDMAQHDKENYPALSRRPLASSEMDRTPLGHRQAHLQQRGVLTPPTSSSPDVDFGKIDRDLRRPLRNMTNTALPPQAAQAEYAKMTELEQIYQERIEFIRRNEAERFGALEQDYKRQIERLERDLTTILQKQDEVTRLKGTVNMDMKAALDKAVADLRHERAARRSERERFELRIQDLQAKVEDLQKKLRRFAAQTADQDKGSAARSYEGRLQDLQQAHDQKTSELIRQFEREKQSALQIMKTRIKSEVNLLVPRIRSQCQEAFGQALSRCQEQTAQKYREKYGGVIQKLKEEHLAEKRFVQKQAKEQADAEKAEWQRKMRERYEVKTLEVKNECERRLLDRMRSGRTKASNVSFALSELSVLSEGSAFTEDSLVC